MKIKVIGWTYYDDDTYEEGDVTYAAYHAIVDDVKENKYTFTGWDHQESSDCAPILSDGKIRRFTQRGWGGLMAEANGLSGRYAYSTYAFNWLDDDDDTTVRPKGAAIDPKDILTDEEMSEHYTVKVRSDALARAEKSGKIKLNDLPEYRYISSGDTITLTSNAGDVTFRITAAGREKKLPKRDIDNYLYMTYLGSDEKEKQITEKYEKAPTEWHLAIEKIN